MSATTLFRLWDARDYLVWTFIAAVFVVVVVDVRYNATEVLSKRLPLGVRREDLLFGALAVIVFLFFGLNIPFGYIDHFFAIVDYDDVTLTLLRTRVLTVFCVAYIGLGMACSVACTIMAHAANRNKLKWALYGAIFNVLALLFLVRLRQTEIEVEK